MNAAIEQHVRTCEKCRAEGMVHLATEKRWAVRLARSGGRSGSRLRLIALIATLALLALLVYLLLTSSGHSVHLPHLTPLAVG